MTHVSEENTTVNSAYYGDGGMIHEFMSAATDLFGSSCLLQFEDFNSNDAFPLLAAFREKYLSYNDDISYASVRVQPPRVRCVCHTAVSRAGRVSVPRPYSLAHSPPARTLRCMFGECAWARLTPWQSLYRWYCAGVSLQSYMYCRCHYTVE